jgi:hypothetical protein
MSFHPAFEARWKNVIEPAIRLVEKNNIPLEPVRVDTRRISDSILTEILTGISTSLVVFADVTSLGKYEDRPIRNGNVMYEVGLAHAIRLPEEIVLFRSDSEELLFDVANVRINSYDPDGDPDGAKRKVGTTIVDAIKEVDLKKSLSVKSVAESLDYSCWDILMKAAAEDGIHPPPMKTMGQALGNARHISAISRLLELGALKTNYIHISPDLLNDKDDRPAEQMLKYTLTRFGNAVFAYVISEMGMLSPEVQESLKGFFKTSGDKVA